MTAEYRFRWVTPPGVGRFLATGRPRLVEPGPLGRADRPVLTGLILQFASAANLSTFNAPANICLIQDIWLSAPAPAIARLARISRWAAALSGGATIGG